MPEYLRAMVRDLVVVSPPLEPASVRSVLYAAIGVLDAENGLELLRPWMPQSQWLERCERVHRLGYMLCTPPALPTSVTLRRAPSRHEVRLFITRAALSSLYQYWSSLGQSEAEMRRELQVQEAILNATDDLYIHAHIATLLPAHLLPELHQHVRAQERAHQRARGVVRLPAGPPPATPANTVSPGEPA
jgi:hypothetical protein